MSSIIITGNKDFTGRKMRKLLCPLQFTVDYDGSPPGVGPFAVRVTFVSGTGGGAFSAQRVPSLWLFAGARVVQWPTLFPGNFHLPFTAYAAYKYTLDRSPERVDTADFTISIVDTGNGNAPLLTQGYSIKVTALPALDRSVYFLLDRTGAMQVASGGSTRFQRAKNAVINGLALFTPSDRVGLISLDSISPASPSGGAVQAPIASPGVDAATIACNNLPPDQSVLNRVYQTSLNFTNTQDPTATVVLVTDGVGVAPSTTFPAALQTFPTSSLFVENPDPLASSFLHSSNGTYGISSAATAEFAMEKLLSQILIDLGGLTVVSDPDGSLDHEQKLTFPLNLNETDHELEVILFSDQAHLLKLDLVGPGLGPSQRDAQLPNGSHPDGSHPDGSHYEASRHDGPHHPEPCDDNDPPEPKTALVLRRSLAPVSPDTPREGPSHTVVVSRAKHPGPTPPGPVRFTFTAAVVSELMFDAYATASGPEVGADLLFSAKFTEYELPVRDRPGITVFVELRHPDGWVEQIPLPEHSGHFEASRRAFRPGVYTVHFIATGRTMLQNKPFRREALRSVVIFETGASGHCCSK